MEIRTEMERLKNADTNYSNVEKLAMLSIVKSELDTEDVVMPRYSFAAEPESEFLNACTDVPYMEVLKVMNEHMDAVKVLYPKEYSSVMRRIKRLTNE